MDWASKRRASIIAIIVVLALFAIAAVAIPALYHTPTCTDNKQNQDERGVDCGGSCQVVCRADALAPSVRFTRVLAPFPGRADVLAYIDNPNASAEAPSANYTLDLYDANHAKLATRTGSIYLPPSSTVPLFIASAYRGPGTVTEAFLTIDSATLLWTKPHARLATPLAESPKLESSDPPRISGVLMNQTAHVMYDTEVVASVYGASGNVIGASSTVVPSLPSQGSTPLVFTWNNAFDETPIREEFLVVPAP